MASWQGRAGTRTQRGYGSKWSRKTRPQILQRDLYLCQVCKAKGRTKAAHAVDHITPKAKGGTDHPDNLQAICKECHATKSSQEGQEAQQELRDQGKTFTGADGWPIKPKVWGYSIPHGLQPSAIEVTVICGPPGSGKTTYANQHAAKADKIIDLDEILVRVGGVEWDTRSQYVNKALAYRDMAIRGLSRQTAGRAWLIVTGKTPDERKTWLDALGPKASLKVMNTPKQECLDRVKADPRRKEALEAHIRVINEWQ